MLGRTFNKLGVRLFIVASRTKTAPMIGCLCVWSSTYFGCVWSSPLRRCIESQYSVCTCISPQKMTPICPRLWMQLTVGGDITVYHHHQHTLESHWRKFLSHDFTLLMIHLIRWWIEYCSKIRKLCSITHKSWVHPLSWPRYSLKRTLSQLKQAKENKKQFSTVTRSKATKQWSWSSPSYSQEDNRKLQGCKLRREYTNWYRNYYFKIVSRQTWCFRNFHSLSNFSIYRKTFKPMKFYETSAYIEHLGKSKQTINAKRLVFETSLPSTHTPFGELSE